jgi:hypothetical protein
MAFKDIDFTKTFAILELGRISEKENTDAMTDILKVEMFKELEQVINQLNR